MRCCATRTQAAKAAAEEMKENVSALSKLHEQDMALLHQQHEQEMALLREVASDTKDVKKMTAQLQAMMAAESSKANSVLSGVLEARQCCVRLLFRSCYT